MRITLTFACVVVVGLLGCGDNARPGESFDASTTIVDAPEEFTPDAEVIDAEVIDAVEVIDGVTDASTCPAHAAGDIGGTCAIDTDCDSAPGAADGFCLVGAVIGWPDAGYCIQFGCTVDGDCGDGNQCISFEGTMACLPQCCDDGSCPVGQTCTDNYIGSLLSDPTCLPADPAAQDGDPCNGFFECDVNSICRRDNLEYPDGQCITVRCTPGNDDTCTSDNGHCVNLPDTGTPANGCLDTCTVDTDCRQDTGYECFNDPTLGRYCRHPHAGDACTVDTDCGAAAIWDCKTGPGFPQGYCTVTSCFGNTDQGCTPISSFCLDVLGNDIINQEPTRLDNYCVDRCPAIGTTSTCRDGYTCVDVNTRTGENTGGCVSAAI